MKTILTNAAKQLKVLMTLDGKVIVTLPGGQQKEGVLPERELMQLAHRVTALTAGEVAFTDPEPQDFFVQLDDAEKTLELQAIALDELRQKVVILDEACTNEAAKYVEIQERLTACENDLVEARGALKDTRTELSNANEQLAIALQTSTEVSAEPEVAETPIVAEEEVNTITPAVTVEGEGTPASYVIVKDEPNDTVRPPAEEVTQPDATGGEPLKAEDHTGFEETELK